MADVDQRIRLDRRIAVGREERDAFGAEVIDDRLERRLVAAGHRHQLGEGLRTADRLALGVDVGQRPEQVLDDLPAVGIRAQPSPSPRRRGPTAAWRGRRRPDSPRDQGARPDHRPGGMTGAPRRSRTGPATPTDHRAVWRGRLGKSRRRLFVPVDVFGRGLDFVRPPGPAPAARSCAARAASGHAGSAAAGPGRRRHRRSGARPAPGSPRRRRAVAGSRIARSSAGRSIRGSRYWVLLTASAKPSKRAQCPRNSERMVRMA